MVGDRLFVNYDQGPQLKTTTGSNYYPLSEASGPNPEQRLWECLLEKLENINKDENNKTSSEAARSRMSASQRYTGDELALNGKSPHISNSLRCADKARSPMIISDNKETSGCGMQNDGDKVESSLAGPRKICANIIMKSKKGAAARNSNTSSFSKTHAGSKGSTELRGRTVVLQGDTISDSGIANMNRLIVQTQEHITAEEIWNFGKKLGVSYSVDDTDIIERIQMMEDHDQEGRRNLNTNQAPSKQDENIIVPRRIL
ncbi:hypothetical protein Ancab_002392 [Ancistrocladus abbreviatus]